MIDPTSFGFQRGNGWIGNWAVIKKHQLPFIPKQEMMNELARRVSDSAFSNHCFFYYRIVERSVLLLCSTQEALERVEAQLHKLEHEILDARKSNQLAGMVR